MQRLTIHIKGIVQGVGFRPFVYNLAKRLELGGWVFNNSQGVELEIEGGDEEVAVFLYELKNSAPPLAVIDDLIVSQSPLKGEQTFSIKQSREHGKNRAWVAPDVATCLNCQMEIRNNQDRRYGYAFTNCTHCGPRYSIIKDVPYDREATTMSQFPMCPSCQSEYDDPSNRRFHAQPNACPICGPHYCLINKAGEVTFDNVFEETKKMIAAGHIVAIKGIGGYHLACDGRNEQAVSRLRSRKIREYKPFAVMCGSMETIDQLCTVSVAEEQLLQGSAHPIVLLAKKNHCQLAKSVAPGNAYLGIMLPYAPVHYLLLEPNDIWVMTSANISDEPIIYDDHNAQEMLAEIADYSLVHNRDIHRPSDDSVVRVIKEKQYILRRSRGFAPSPLKLSREISSILAVGGEVKNAFCLTQGHFAFMSPHIGDLEDLGTYTSYLASIAHYKKLFTIDPIVVAHDLHPEYAATKYALTLDIPKIGVQHHHAHIASVLAEHGFNEQVIGVAFDGTGYGSDGKLWGGEFLIADCSDFIRVGHCKYIPLPGGAKAIKEPWRLGAWVLYNLYGLDFADFNLNLSRNLPVGWQIMIDATQKGINAPLSSSAGRLFDIAATLLGLGTVIHYEGQAAVELEFAAQKNHGQLLPYTISVDNPRILDFMPTFASMAEAMRRGENVNFLAASFHVTVSQGIVEMIRLIHQDTGIRKVALSGGVWQNRILFEKVVGMLQQSGFDVYSNQRVPTNDGGLALGQAVVAGTRIIER
ncbi:carbamoyltransferase HypF [Pelosinus sp. sgz500959]|uniref:carbamoyltransferase HypF n=1 Tax=Pelosinus sp. sgz500959 TaxID=3242472 RepID=UPI00366B1677